jgi:hypothetical protein
MKPIGLSATFQVVRSTRAEDAVWAAVEEAICAGMTPEQFKEEAAQAWEHCLREEAKHAVKVLSK